MLSCVFYLSGGEIAAAPKSVDPSGVAPEPTAQSKRTKKDRGDASMQLGDVEWKGTSARARVKEKTGTLIVSASRTDGSSQTGRVRQSIELYLSGYDGPGSYAAAIGSMFLVAGLNPDAQTGSQMNAAVVRALSQAEHLHQCHLNCHGIVDL